MELPVKTSVLQDLVAKSIRGVGNNKLLPITSLMEIDGSDGILSLRTTDSTNYLTVSSNLDGESNFYAVVEADTFAKLIGRITTPDITLTIGENGGSLKISGNGNYTLPLPLDENGKTIVFPDIDDVYPAKPNAIIPLFIIQTILNSVKSAISPTIDVPCYMNYYVGEDCVIATDTAKINALINQNLVDKPILISNAMMNLLGIMSEDKITMLVGEKTILFDSFNCSVCGYIPEGINDFQIDVIKNLIDAKFEHVISVSKQELLQTLDRLSLFVDPYDQNGVDILIEEWGMEKTMHISSMSSDASDPVEILEYDNFENFTAKINVFDFLGQVKSLALDRVELWYGPGNAIKLTDDNVVHIIALITE